MLQNSKMVDTAKAQLKPITATGTNPYGFGLIYPETVQYLRDAIEDHLQSKEELFASSVISAVSFKCLETYIRICSMISRSRPMPRINLYEYDHNTLRSLDTIGLISLGPIEEGKQSVFVYRKEPVNE